MTAMTPEPTDFELIPARPVELTHSVTPLHRLPRISADLRRDVWIKRDDLTDVGVGGNKIRKLEYLMGEALDQHADVVVTIGAPQSNHCRAVAAASSILGLDCILILGGEDPAEHRGNIYLDDLLGAQLEFTPGGDWASNYEAAVAACDRLRTEGRTPYLMPVGGSTATGALGYVRGYAEILKQAQQVGIESASIVHAIGSGGTTAGLLAGRELLGGPYDPVAVTVAESADLMGAVSSELAKQALQLLSLEATPTATVLDGYLGDGYGIPSDAGQNALNTLLEREGILLDPVYSAKAFSALLAQDPAIDDGPVIFLHTGGLPSVFA